jgi:class 3 adenylate cyclase
MRSDNTVNDAVIAAFAAQRRLQHEARRPTPVKVRMGIHTGTTHAGVIGDRAGGYDDYLTLTRAQRIMTTLTASGLESLAGIAQGKGGRSMRRDCLAQQRRYERPLANHYHR